jgi:hypothetical protein
VKSLTDNLLPNLGQLFDCTRVLSNYTVNADGSVTSGGGWDVSPLIYCAGATSAITNLPLRSGDLGGPYIALYDANGNFLESLPSTYFGAAWGTVAPPIMGASVAFPLPGTQTYIRFGWTTANQGGSPYPVNSACSFYATSSGTATISSTYQPFGIPTISTMNTAIAAGLAIVPSSMLEMVLPGPAVNVRNGFDYNKALYNMLTNSDGTVSAGTATYVGTAYCPGATTAITNIPFFATTGSTVTVNSYDAEGNFIADISASLISYSTGGRITANTAFPLPGNQASIKFTFPAGSLGTPWAKSLLSCVFFSGTTSAPPATNLYSTPLYPFVGNTSPYTRTATSLGATTDGFADASGVLNAFLATASSSNPIELVLDGFVLANLVISPNGYTTIRGLGHGTGIIISDPTQDVLRIGAYTPTTGGSGDSEGAYNSTLPARSTVNICLRDFTVNAGGQVEAAINQPVTGAVAHATYGVMLTSCSDVMIDNLYWPTNGFAYCLCLSNVDHVRVTNCIFNTGGTLHDGIHIDGPSNDIAISNCDITTGDDAIALNAPEGYGGDISRVTITNCRFFNSLSVMRIYTSLDPAYMPTNNVHKVRDVVISNCSGFISGICFGLGIEGAGLTSTSDVDQIQDFSISNCTFSAPTNLMRVRDNIGSISLSGVKFIPTSTNPIFDLGGYGVGELSLTDFTVLRNPDGNAACDVILVSGTVDKLSLIHCRVTDEEGSSYTAMSSWVNNAGTVSNLRLEAVDMTHMAALTAGSSWTGFTTVKGSGVLGTCVQIPDANMDNNALYLSSNDSGAPSIKVSGTAKRLTLA